MDVATTLHSTLFRVKLLVINELQNVEFLQPYIISTFALHFFCIFGDFCGFLCRVNVEIM